MGDNDITSDEGKLSPRPSSPSLDIDTATYGQDTKPLEVCKINNKVNKHN